MTAATTVDVMKLVELIDDLAELIQKLIKVTDGLTTIASIQEARLEALERKEVAHAKHAEAHARGSTGEK